MAPMAVSPCVGFCELADVATHNNYFSFTFVLKHIAIAVTTASAASRAAARRI